jgi:nucleoside 2-deoxyribosyltransferase
MTKIFLAGPLFTAPERCFNADLARFLEAKGFEVWLPQENEPRNRTAQAIFRKDVEGIDCADMIIACMDGPYTDSGTAWECGYAFAKGKPIVCYRTDFRVAGEAKASPYNLMLSESATSHFELPLGNQIVNFRSACLSTYEKPHDQLEQSDRIILTELVLRPGIPDIDRRCCGLQTSSGAI